LRAFLVVASLLVLMPARADDAGNHYPFAAGTIRKVDASGKLLIIATPAGSQTLAVTERTYLFRGKEKLTVDRLKVGEVVKINYYTNETGQAFIRRLKVALPPSP
jgi:hypothetical protein